MGATLTRHIAHSKAKVQGRRPERAKLHAQPNIDYFLRILAFLPGCTVRVQQHC
jgi:hypothetical protein